ncbi:Crp/Fnr family transcriptional regulator [Croceimicrobium hydrocarbonivorans]|uniref:Crp/Fnr family transcriptional regulator n=1 Tax=Croceimicrobium hydrocarbonivorans TaxID=2761580 RepID=A0A7H0VHI5_9FLAO|nr:Crp/Fnr family transcriptional regulator [Croceimicrobium hydrocarbonivorans]QNR25183.1 Crp/Fnr family transcriptional regulator [Croceimicrobium hydrocarbonivorans]
MENKFVSYFSSISPLSPDEAQAIAGSMQTRSFKKGDFLLKEGQISGSTYFILEGCIREYILTDGEEKTTNFYTEEQWAISLNSFDQQIPAKHNWICAEDCEVVQGDEEQAQAIFKKFPRFETLSRTIMEAAFAEQREALNSYYTDSPEERYLKLLKSRPSLLQRIPQYQIASYIGVKPESLSRIRKRIAKGLD